MNYALLLDPLPPSECARQLGRVRQDQAREARKAFHRAMNIQMGREIPEALR